MGKSPTYRDLNSSPLQEVSRPERPSVRRSTYYIHTYGVKREDMWITGALPASNNQLTPMEACPVPTEVLFFYFRAHDELCTREGFEQCPGSAKLRTRWMISS